jgi:hypothetical protein
MVDLYLHSPYIFMAGKGKVVPVLN